MSAFPLVILDAIAIQLRRTVAFEERRKQIIPVLTAIDGADFYLLENHFQQLNRIKTQYLVSNLSTFDVRLAGATVDGKRVYVQLQQSVDFTTRSLASAWRTDFCDKVGKWRNWLALVSSAIANRDNDSEPCGEVDQICQVESIQCSISPGELTLAHPLPYFEAVLPKWFWTPPEGPWKCDFPDDTPLKSYALISQYDWNKAISFFQSIEWVLNDQRKTFFLELAFMSWENGYILQNGSNPAECATLLRKCVNQATAIITHIN